VKDLPYPYTSKAQFERAMERPLGVEWNTRVAFQRGTLPKVVKKVRCLRVCGVGNDAERVLSLAWCYYRSSGKAHDMISVIGVLPFALNYYLEYQSYLIWVRITNTVSLPYLQQLF
jgi:hypothetical protein